MEPFRPSQFAKRPAVAEVESQLRSWLRQAPVEERAVFLEQLWPINPYFALSLAHTSQLPNEVAARLLEQWLQGHCNHAKAIIEAFVPLLGERKFWQVVSQVEVPRAMAKMLEYQRNGT